MKNKKKKHEEGGLGIGFGENYGEKIDHLGFDTLIYDERFRVLCWDLGISWI